MKTGSMAGCKRHKNGHPECADCTDAFLAQRDSHIGYGHTGPCQPGCTCDIAKGLRETSLRRQAARLTQTWADDCSTDSDDKALGELEDRIFGLLRTVEREALERAAKECAGYIHWDEKNGKGDLADHIRRLAVGGDTR